MGREYHRLLLAEGAKADPIDLSLVVAEYDSVCRRGVDGRITTESLKAFLIEYNQKLIRTPANNRKSDLAEAEMINVIVFKDPDIRDRYATAIEVSAPTTLVQATGKLKTLLRRDTRYAQIDALNSGSPAGAALLAREQALEEHEKALEAERSSIRAVSVMCYGWVK